MTGTSAGRECVEEGGAGQERRVRTNPPEARRRACIPPPTTPSNAGCVRPSPSRLWLPIPSPALPYPRSSRPPPLPFSLQLDAYLVSCRRARRRRTPIRRPRAGRRACSPTGRPAACRAPRAGPPPAPSSSPWPGRTARRTARATHSTRDAQRATAPRQELGSAQRRRRREQRRRQGRQGCGWRARSDYVERQQGRRSAQQRRRSAQRRRRSEQRRRSSGRARECPARVLA